MNRLQQFFSREAGQQRGAALNNFLRTYLDEPLRYYLGPTGIPDRINALAGALQYTDAGDMVEAADASAALWNDPSLANAARYATAGAAMAIPFVGAKMMQDGVDVVGDAVRSFGDDARRFAADESGALNIPRAPFDMGGGSATRSPTLREVLDVRAAQMELPPAARIQPDAGGSGFLDRDYFTPAPSDTFDDLSQYYPRNPDAAAALPKGDRARVLVDRKEELSDALAARIAATGQMDADTRYFYHSDGPIYRGARAAGLSVEEAEQYLRDLGGYVAATSPRTKVEENLRNATLAMAKENQGIPFREIVGPGSGGISEKGYPMMTGKGGIHGLLLDDVIADGRIDSLTNPKPANFGPNIAGNRSGVTVDTHAIRGTLQTLNEMEPGSVPEGFILPRFRDAYRADPTTLTPDMIDDTLAGQMIGPKGQTMKAQTEYPVFADIWHGAADRLGVSPAEAQSMGWFGFGDQTNLGSARKTPVDIFDERLSVTAKALNLTPEEAARAVFRRQIPLLGVGGAALLGQYQPSPTDEIEAFFAENGL